MAGSTAKASFATVLPSYLALAPVVASQEEVIHALLDALYDHDSPLAGSLVEALGLHRFMLPREELQAIAEKPDGVIPDESAAPFLRNPTRHKDDLEADAQRARIEWNHRIIRVLLQYVDGHVPRVAEALIQKFQLDAYRTLGPELELPLAEGEAMRRTLAWIDLLGAPDTFVPPNK